MRRIRVIPVLQIMNRRLVKTTRFASPSYVGDPLNALRIFNEKQVDEIAILDIGSSRNGTPPDIEYIRLLASECFMPMSYGGGINESKQAAELFQAGIEKIIIGTAFYKSPELIKTLSSKYGSQSIVVSIDVKRDWLGSYKVFVKNGSVNSGNDPMSYAIKAQTKGAGEILLTNIDRENLQNGYDELLIEKVSSSVTIPVVPIGGANSIESFLIAVRSGASGVAAGNFFIYKGSHKSILINYPDHEKLLRDFYSKI